MPVSRWDERGRLLSASGGDGKFTLRNAQGGIICRTEINATFPWMENGDKTVSVDVSVLLPPIEIADEFRHKFPKELSVVRLLIYRSQTAHISVTCHGKTGTYKAEPAFA